MSKAVYAGSFDPITFGHVNIIERVAPLFDGLIVLVAHDPHKNYLFSPEERKSLGEASIKGTPNVEVAVWDGLTVDYLKKMKAKCLIRGIRSISDYDHEWTMASMNRKLNAEIETFFILADPEYNFISSRAVKEVAYNNGPVTSLVPKIVVQALQKKIKQLSK